MTRLILLVPTVGAKPGDEIEVVDKATADALVANGSARRAPAKKSADSLPPSASQSSS